MLELTNNDSRSSPKGKVGDARSLKRRFLDSDAAAIDERLHMRKILDASALGAGDRDPSTTVRDHLSAVDA